MANDKPKEAELFTCQNDYCKKSFAKPLKAFDLHANPGEAYEACPFCLSKIETHDENISTLPDEKPLAPSKTSATCLHHLGYLCERTDKNRIPDECMLCGDVVSCMLHTLKK